MDMKMNLPCLCIEKNESKKSIPFKARKPIGILYHQYRPANFLFSLVFIPDPSCPVGVCHTIFLSSLSFFVAIPALGGGGIAGPKVLFLFVCFCSSSAVLKGFFLGFDIWGGGAMAA